MNKKIAVIEDNSEIRDNIVEILELDGYDVHAAENGKKGVLLVEAEKPDLIICDIMMPELDGYGVLHILNKKPELNKIPFIFLTAKAEKSDFRKGMNLGADDYITKPFEADELLQTIERRIEKMAIRDKDYSGDLVGFDSFLTDAKAQLALDNLAEDKEVKIFEKKENVFRAGKKAYHLFYILSGQVKLLEENTDGKELITRIAKQGDFIGYSALIQNEPYHIDAVALEKSEICIIPKNAFLDLMYKDVNVSHRFIKMLCNELQNKEVKLIQMAYNSVRKRVADSLISLVDQAEEDNTNQKVTVLREDLAAMVGTAKESAIRALCDLKEAGLVKIESGYIEILKFDELKNLNW